MYQTQIKRARDSRSFLGWILVIIGSALAAAAIGYYVIGGLILEKTPTKLPPPEVIFSANAVIKTGVKSTSSSPSDNTIREYLIPGGQYSKYKKVPVLMYHYIREMPGDDDQLGQVLSVTPANFENQLKYLQSNGYESITINQLKNGDVPAKPVVITFDDGYKDAYANAFPILEKYNMKGVFYVVAGWTNREIYLNWDEIIEMDRAGMEIGSHTMTHRDVTSLIQSPNELKRQIEGSKDLLESKLGHSINDFCYPYGTVSNDAITAVYKAGYRTATTTMMGSVKKGDYWMYLPRLRVHDNSDFNTLLNKY